MFCRFQRCKFIFLQDSTQFIKSISSRDGKIFTYLKNENTNTEVVEDGINLTAIAESESFIDENDDTVQQLYLPGKTLQINVNQTTG